MFWAAARDIPNCPDRPNEDIPYIMEKFTVFAARLKSFGTGFPSAILKIFLKTTFPFFLKILIPLYQ